MATQRVKTDMNIPGVHIPVMLRETINELNLSLGLTVVDCTTNRAGHSLEIAKIIGNFGTLICIDLDNQALSEAKKNIESNISKENLPTVHYINSNFSKIEDILKSLNIQKVDRVLADLGLSSQELDVSGRGFSFMRDEPLLMTFENQDDISNETLTAKDIVNSWSEETLSDILFYFSDERYAKRIAKNICERRKEKEIKTTFDLVDIIRSSVPAVYRNGKTNCATKTFQAIRMSVNREIDSIKDLIKSFETIIKEGGLVSVITFHSTEDRIVKQAINDIKELKKINKKPTTASELEIKNNTRSRSAKLRTYKYDSNNYKKNKYSKKDI